MCLVACGSAAAQDADRDGMSDAVETLLGTDPQTPETFTVIWENKGLTPGKPPKDPGRTIRSIAIANAGGNRFIWRAQFAADYPPNSLLQLYLDSDNDKSTGRQGNHGCEFMLRRFDKGTSTQAFERDGSSHSAPAPRVAVAGTFVYYSFDVDLAQAGGQSRFRMSLLSEVFEPHGPAHGTGYFAAAGPPIGSAPKILMDADRTESVGIGQTCGLDQIEQLMENPRNVVLPIRQCELDGFRLDAREYRADNAVATAAGGSITAKVPAAAAGRFHAGFILYDTGGREAIAIEINGKRRGLAVGRSDDNNQHLFFLSEAVEVKGGDEIRLRMIASEGRCRIEDLVLLRDKPTPRPPLYELRHVAAHENRLTWITTWTARCTVQVDGAKPIIEDQPIQNHRVTIPGLKRGSRLRYRITAETREGRSIATDWREHTWAAPSEPPTTKKGQVLLHVEPPAHVAGLLRGWPVTSGVPFPRGVLGSSRNVRLLDSAGKAVPLQAAVTGRWSDGSVKWLLLDFRHSGGPADYVLEYGPAIQRPPGPTLEASRLELGEIVLTDDAGKQHTQALTDWTEEEAGPLRTCFKAAGRIGQTSFAFEARAHVYPGLPWVRVLLTTGHGESKDEFTTLRNLAWRLPLAGRERSVRQLRDDSFQSTDGGGKRFTGPVGAIHLRDFWLNYPKAVEVGPKGSTVWLMPPLAADEYAGLKGKHDEHKLFFWFALTDDGHEGGYRLRQGMTRTHEVWLGMDGKGPPLDRPVLAVASPRWYARSGALGELAVADPDRAVIREYDQKVAATLKAYLANRERNREYGMWNFGDWWGERVINWGNVEYDTQHAFFLQFARSGDLRFFQAGEEAELHNRDVDTVHYHRDAQRVGGAYAHCIGHVGNYYAKSPLPGRNQGTAGGHFSVSHTWCEGHIDHYFLTGDRRSLETALKIADRYDTQLMRGYDFTNTRVPGWHLILTMAAYRATGDEFYLNAARIIVERVLERQTPRPKFNTRGGGWRRMMVPGHCLCTPAHYGNAGFMVGVLLTGLKWYHIETQDPRVARSIAMGAHFLIDDMWAEEVNGFRYTSCPKSSAGAWSNFLLFDGIAYAYRLSQQAGKPDQKLALHLRKGTASGIQAMSGMGKSFSQFIRVTPHFLNVLAELEDKSTDGLR